MKLKNQFKLFITGSIIIPLLCAVALPVYYYFTDPKHALLRDYGKTHKIWDSFISKNDWKTLREIIKQMPPHIESAIIMNHRYILLSNIPELKTGGEIDDSVLFTTLQISSKKYFYQFVAASLEDDSADILIIRRIPRNDAPKKIPHIQVMIGMLFALLVTELFTVIFIVKISNTISRSISILGENTRRIADGELDVELHTGVNTKDSNEITSLTENLDKMRRNLKENQERRARFIMGISHDLRTPVAVIKGYTEAIADGIADDPEMIKNALGIIGAKTDQLETMVETLINYVKLNNSDLKETLSEQLIEPVLKEFAESAVMTGKVFKRSISSSINVSKTLSLPFNKQLLLRALENIYSNALRYSRDGDLISIAAEEDKNDVRISISDTGIGIDKSERERIFDLFYKASNSRREEGMGIGLSVVKNIADAHGWKIDVDENKGGGTIFTIVIPKMNLKTKDL
ncbi:HAMP domain-containing sensor histidine kinase [Treponema parvum]|uniref:HAMP domain-containing sensor histidine kinase n=1 Tax=Treponema parvum TaxID=138851 RepID=UPI001AEC18F7|nr:HAMP domain-containing sensor histidine kinase [Treponema parvum]QTQ16321.1 HAMP domain-containing histidine kinase [Treponema parvum]